MRVVEDGLARSDRSKAKTSSLFADSYDVHSHIRKLEDDEAALRLNDGPDEARPDGRGRRYLPGQCARRNSRGRRLRNIEWRSVRSGMYQLGVSGCDDDDPWRGGNGEWVCRLDGMEPLRVRHGTDVDCERHTEQHGSRARAPGPIPHVRDLHGAPKPYPAIVAVRATESPPSGPPRGPRSMRMFATSTSRADDSSRRTKART